MPDADLKPQTSNCNLGEAEIKRRYRIGFIGLFLTILVICILEFSQAGKDLKWIIFFPVFYALSGFIQGAKKFCYLYGYSGVLSLSGRRKFEKLTDPEERRHHRSRAMRMASVIFLLSGIITVTYIIMSK